MTDNDVTIGDRARFRIDGERDDMTAIVDARAWDTDGRRLVAIRRLDGAVWASDPRTYHVCKAELEREYTMLLLLAGHPTIPIVYDLLTDDGTVTLVSEHFPHGSLADRLTRGPIPLPDALLIAADAARALGAAHSREIVHTRLTPASIMLTDDRRAKVGDWAYCQTDAGARRVHQPDPKPGDPRYTAPEQEESRTYLSPNTDQYSLGLILFETVTGRVYKQVTHGERSALLASTPEPVTALLRHMLAGTSDNYFPSMDALAHAMDIVSQTLATSASPNDGTEAIPTGEPNRLVTIPAGGAVNSAPPTCPREPSTSPLSLPAEQRIPRRAIMAALGGLAITSIAGVAGLRRPSGAQSAVTSTATQSPSAAIPPPPLATATEEPTAVAIAATPVIAIATATVSPTVTIGAPATDPPTSVAVATPTVPASAAAPSSQLGGSVQTTTTRSAPGPARTPGAPTPSPGVLASKVAALREKYLPEGASVTLIAPDGETVHLDDTLLSAAASTIKLPIYLTLAHHIDTKAVAFDWKTLVVIRPENVVDGTGVLQHQVGSTHTIRDIASLMITESDNVGANILLARLGGWQDTQNAHVRAGAPVVTEYIKSLDIAGFVMQRGLQEPGGEVAVLNKVTTGALAAMLSSVVDPASTLAGVPDLRALLAARGQHNPWHPEQALDCGLAILRIAGGYPADRQLDGIRLDALSITTSGSSAHYLLSVAVQTTLADDQAAEARIARFEGEIHNLLTGQWAQCVDTITRQR